MADQPLSDQEREDLIAYLDGELTESEAQALEGKLKRDPRVKSEAEALRRTWDLLDYLPKPEPSVSFTHRTMDRVTTMLPPANGWNRGRRWLLGLSWAAALLLATLAGYAAAPRLLERKSDTVSADQQVVQDQRLLERLRLYQHVDDIYFLNELDQHDLFGDDRGGF